MSAREAEGGNDDEGADREGEPIEDSRLDGFVDGIPVENQQGEGEHSE